MTPYTARYAMCCLFHDNICMVSKGYLTTGHTPHISPLDAEHATRIAWLEYEGGDLFEVGIYVHALTRRLLSVLVAVAFTRHVLLEEHANHAASFRS